MGKLGEDDEVAGHENTWTKIPSTQGSSDYMDVGCHMFLTSDHDVGGKFCIALCCSRPSNPAAHALNQQGDEITGNEADGVGTRSEARW